MADKNGWVKLHTSLADKAIWKDSDSKQRDILITLLMMANWKESQWIWKGEKYICKPGQFITSLPSIQKRCGKGVSIKNIRTALVRFEVLGFLAGESTNRNRKITIVNWDTYQSLKAGTGRPNGRQTAGNRQATGRLPAAIEDSKTIRQLTTSYEKAFELIWKAYPNRKNQSKRKAYEAYLKYIKNRVPIKDVLDAIEKQKKSKPWKKDDGEFIPHCATWINGCMWESESDEDEVRRKKEERQQRDSAEAARKQDDFLNEHREYILDAKPEVLRKRCERDYYLRDAVNRIRPEVLK